MIPRHDNSSVRWRNHSQAHTALRVDRSQWVLRCCRIVVVLCFVVVGIGIPLPVVAQEFTAPQYAYPSTSFDARQSTDDVSRWVIPPHPTQLDLQNRELKSERNRFQSGLDSATGQLPYLPAPLTARPLIVEAMEQEFGVLEQRRTAGYQSIHEQLDRLEQLLMNPVCNSPPSTFDSHIPVPLLPAPFNNDESSPGLPRPEPDDTIEEPDESAPADTQVDKPQSRNTPGGASAADPIDSVKTTNVQQDGGTTTTAAGPQLVTATSIDRLSLANNLFGNQEFALARDIYLELETESLDPEDLTWVRYQLGCCHRRLDAFDDAARYYRQVVGAKGSELYRELARWWLDAIRERNELRRSVDDLRFRVQHMEDHGNAPGI